jgi:hypothetical protein
MTVALVLAAEADAGLRGQLAALGVGRVDAAGQTGPGLLTVAAAARAARERMLICVGDDIIPEGILARLLGAPGTAAFTGARAPEPRPAPDDADQPRPEARAAGGALVVDTDDLAALAGAAELLAATQAAPAAVGALLGELTRAGVRVRVLDAGPDGDGVIAALIDPVARDLARWAATRDLTPAALAGISLGLGLLSAVWFAEPTVKARLLASLILLAAFTAGRSGAHLAAVGRIRPAADWLAAASGLVTEFAVYAALAISAGLIVPGRPAGLNGIFGGAMRHSAVASFGGAGQPGVWRLAVAALLLLGARRLAELCYEGLARASGHMFPRPARRLFGQVITLPAGERYAVIAITAVCFGPRLTFDVLLAWSVVAAVYVLIGLVASAGQLTRVGGVLTAYRGDGAVARRLGRAALGLLPPLPPLLVGLLVTCDLALLGLANLPGILVLAPVMAMLLAGLGARNPHDGRLDWLVPPLLLTGEGVFLAALGFSRHVWLPVVFAVLAAVVLRHMDLAYRARSGLGVRQDRFGLGWDGRMLLASLAAVGGFVPFGYALLAVYLWLLAGWDFLSAWLKSLAGPRRP